MSPQPAMPRRTWLKRCAAKQALRTALVQPPNLAVIHTGSGALTPGIL